MLGLFVVWFLADNNETLTELRLAWNQIRHAGVHHLALGIAVSQLRLKMTVLYRSETKRSMSSFYV